MYIFVVGSPKTGKSTLAGTVADALCWPVVASDDWASSPWDDVPRLVRAAALAHKHAVIEGVAVSRLLPGRTRLELAPSVAVWCRAPAALEQHIAYRGMTAWVMAQVLAFRRRYPGRVVEVSPRWQRPRPPRPTARPAPGLPL